MRHFLEFGIDDFKIDEGHRKSGFGDDLNFVILRQVKHLRLEVGCSQKRTGF